MFQTNRMILLVALLASGGAYAAVGATQYTLDPARSELAWEGQKKLIDTKHSGTIALKAGSLQAKNTDIITGSFEIDMNSIIDKDLDSAEYNAKLIGHLKSEDFFDVAKHPTAKFVVKKVKAIAGKDGTTHEVTGELTIKGKTLPVTFPAMITQSGDELSAKGELTIDRTKWGLRYGSDQFFKSLGDKVIRDEIRFKLNLVAKKS